MAEIARRIILGAVLAMTWPQLAIRSQDTSTFGRLVEGKLIVGLPDQSQQVLERADLLRLTRISIRVKSDEKSSVYSGVPLNVLLEYAGVKLTSRTASLTSAVVVQSVDGSSVIFAVAELDKSLGAKRVILADTKDGKPLGAPEGPFHMIVPDEKTPERWVKQVWAVYVVQVSEPFKPWTH